MNIEVGALLVMSSDGFERERMVFFLNFGCHIDVDLILRAFKVKLRALIKSSWIA